MSRCDVFVSYSQPDRGCAFELVEQLEAHDISVWIAPRDITPAADWAAEIIEAICASRMMVLVFSTHCNSSPQVCREVERAVHRQVPVLVFRVEDVLPAGSLEYFLGTQHWFDAFPPPRAPHYVRLRTQIVSLLSRLEQAGPATTGTVRQLNSALSPDAKPPMSLSAPELESLERRLAYHVGPVAKYLVKQAVAQASDREQLTAVLAAEIESPAARQQFINGCRGGTAPRI